VRLALVSTAGCVLAFITLALERPGELSDADADDLAELLLRMLGMAADDAAEVGHRPLPSVP
jgi:hypothetical protein